MRLLGVRVKLHWGFSVRTPLGSKLQASYRLPPPPTVVGALAAACAEGKRELDVVKGVSMSAVFAEEYRVRWAAAAWGSYSAPTTLQIRYFTGPYQSFRTLQEIAERGTVSELFAPVGLGAVIAPGGELILVVVFERDDNGRVKKLRDCSQYVTRVGSKESLVTVKEVGVGTLSPGNSGRTQTYMPIEGLVKYAGYYDVVAFHISYEGGRPSWRCSYALRRLSGCTLVEKQFVAPWHDMHVDVGCKSDCLFGEVLGVRVGVPDQAFWYV